MSRLQRFFFVKHRSLSLVALGQHCADEAEDHAGSDHYDRKADQREAESDKVSHKDILGAVARLPMP